jgi:hypothetical protein
MDDPQPLPLWVIPLFPVFFAGMWLFVTGLIATLSGWSSLGIRFREAPDAPAPTARRFGMASVDLVNSALPLPMSYNNCIVLGLGDAGIHLRTWLPFRFRHPPLLIPWAQVESCTFGRFFFRRAAVLQVRGTGTRIRIYGTPGQAVAEGWERYAAWAARAATA